MDRLKRRLQEDRAMRDAARNVVQADIAYVKGDTKERSLPERAKGTFKDSSQLAAGRALDFARANPVPVAGVLLAILALFFRRALFDILLNMLGDDTPKNSTNQPAAGSPKSRTAPPSPAQPTRPVKKTGATGIRPAADPETPNP